MDFLACSACPGCTTNGAAPESPSSCVQVSSQRSPQALGGSNSPSAVATPELTPPVVKFAAPLKGAPLVVPSIPIEPATSSPPPAATLAEPKPIPTPSTPLPPPQSSPTAQVPAEFNVFPVGLTINGRSASESVLVRGRENGAQAVSFENWLLPYDTVIQALKLNTKALPDGQVEVRSSGLITRIDLTKLRTDPELGLVLSIQEIRTLFGVQAEFNLIEYAIVLNQPRSVQPGQAIAPPEAPVVLEGLPRVPAPKTTVGAIEQRTTVTGAADSQTRSQGDFLAVGSVLGNSWFLRLRQPDLFTPRTWSLGEAQLLRQTDRFDLAVGSQPTFWRSQAASDYWGATAIVRQGFTPSSLYGGGGMNPTQRLQSAQVGRTIVGEAASGTLVRLTQGGLGGRVVAETLVDSSGLYRFENVPFGEQLGTIYRVLLYPRGLLTAQPEIREAVYDVLPGQVPRGASALILSGGWQRRIGEDSFFGTLTDFSGGVAQRWGLSETLTVGVGGVYDDGFKALGEVFLQPKNFPLRVAVSALTGRRWDVNTDIRFQPSPQFNAFFRSDRFSSRLEANWRVFPTLGVFVASDSRLGAGGGLQFSASLGRGFLLGSVSYADRTGFSWNLYQTLGKLQLTHIGRDIGTASQLAYNFSDESALLVNYETRNQVANDSLVSLVGRYQSARRAIDGTPQWEAELGVGIGSRGSGLLASVGTTVLPGLLLRARYQGVSLTSDGSSFGLELVSSLNTQQGIRAGDRRADYARTQGGLLIQPFFDRNNNGQRDRDEESYTDPELVILNNRPIESYRPDTDRDRLLVRLPPGAYRLDFDPAGFPADWQSKQAAVAVEVVAGSYTPIPVPLTRSYIVAGTVTNSGGQPIAGARIEAISTEQGRFFSITNGAGVYYLERLQPGNYTIRINGKLGQPETLKIDESSEPVQELNLKLEEAVGSPTGSNR